MGEQWIARIGLSALLAVIGGILIGITQGANDNQLKAVLAGCSAMSFLIAAMNLLIPLLRAGE